jgi:hypothetical protein
MPVDDRTASRNYQKPAAANLLSEDVVRLRAALDAIDGDVASLAASVLLRAPLASPGFSGTPTAPTPALDSDTQQIITAAYLLGMLSGAVPEMDGAASVGTSTRLARADHQHPTDSSRAPLASPAFTGTPTAPTPSTSDDSTRLATTAWVILQSFVQSARTIFTGAGLTGGGDLSANRTIAPDWATQAEAEARAAADRVMSPIRTGQAIASLLATQAEAEAGSSSTKLMSPLRTNQAIAAAVPPLVMAQVKPAATSAAVAFSLIFG